MELAPSTDWFSTNCSEIESLTKFFSDPNLEENWNDTNIKKVQSAFVQIYDQRNGNLKFLEVIYPLIKDHKKFPIAVAKCYRCGTLDSSTLHYYLSHFIEDYYIGDLLSYYNFIKYYFPVKARQILKHTKIAELEGLYYDKNLSVVIFSHDELSKPLQFDNELSLSFFMLIMYELFANPQKNGERFWRTFFRLIFGCKMPRCGLPILYSAFFESIPPKPLDWDRKMNEISSSKRASLRLIKANKKRKHDETQKMSADFLENLEKNKINSDDLPVNVAYNSLAAQFNNTTSIAAAEYWKAKYEAERLKNISLEEKFNTYAESRDLEITDLRNRFDDFTKQITAKFERTKREFEQKEKEFTKKQPNIRVFKRPERQSHPAVVVFPKRPIVVPKSSLKSVNSSVSQIIPFMKIRRLDDFSVTPTSDVATQPPPRSIPREKNLSNSNTLPSNFDTQIHSKEKSKESEKLPSDGMDVEENNVPVAKNLTTKKKSFTENNVSSDSIIMCDNTIIGSPVSSHESTPSVANILEEIKREVTIVESEMASRV
uniref:C2H2-type domain-containing protein n=1 Tax=Parastrongyloides trichosuri TaxID=131310 RepID=A0A0N4ZUG7_PARTI